MVNTSATGRPELPPTGTESEAAGGGTRRDSQADYYALARPPPEARKVYDEVRKTEVRKTFLKMYEAGLFRTTSPPQATVVAPSNTPSLGGAMRRIAETVLGSFHPRGGGAGEEDDALDGLLEREAARFDAVAGRVAALVGTAAEAAKAGNDRIEANNARLEAAFGAFQGRG